MTKTKYPLRIKAPLPIELEYQGKTRETYALPGELLLIVASNRISTHNIVHDCEIPYKGEVLTALTIHWFIDVLERAGISHHLVAFGQKIYDYLPGRRLEYPRDLHRYAIVVRRLNIAPIEFIYRAYLDGSLWSEYYSKGRENPYGISLPAGLPRMTCFDRVAPWGGPIFTPTEKSDTDDPLSAQIVLEKYVSAVTITQMAFMKGRAFLRKRGIELVDSKFEIGCGPDGRLYLADEALTPDSSRFCRLSEIKEGQAPNWLDKQVARDEAERIWAGGTKHPLSFSSQTIDHLSSTYRKICHGVTDMHLEHFQRDRLDHEFI